MCASQRKSPYQDRKVKLRGTVMGSAVYKGFYLQDSATDGIFVYLPEESRGDLMKGQGMMPFFEVGPQGAPGGADYFHPRVV